MRLATSTGDFSFYVKNITEKIENFEGRKFKYINLEQTGNIPEFFQDGDGWMRLADEWGNAAAKAGAEFVVSHAPCLDGIEHDEETYKNNLRAIRRSIGVCQLLGIKRIVVHACTENGISKKEFYEYNERFYKDLLDLSERYSINILTENVDKASFYFSTGEVMREFLDYMDHPMLNACWDTAHGNIDLVARSRGQYNNIVALGDRLKGLHISDNFGDSHHHSWPFAGVINFDSIMQGLLDVDYDGYFTFEASYTLLHQSNPPFGRKPWEHNGQTVTKLQSPPIYLKKQAVDLLYEVGKYILDSYGCFEE